MSLGDERTLGDGRGDNDTVIDDIEVIDLEARYRIEGKLGHGGMGAVLLATDTRLDRKVAIKRILGDAAGNRIAVQRFLTEAKAIAALNHPNIIQIYDYGRAKDGPFLIMEYVDGGSLLDRCRENALPLDEAIDLACQLCDGLAKAHDLGIIHRDIKPANVLLTTDGIPKLTDFGLAKAQAGDHGQTMTGAVLGTPDFMPPEQRRDAAEVDHRSDLWSLAATVYQMVTGRSPKIIRFNDVPKALQDALARALEDRQDARYQTARALRDALKTSLRAAAVAEPEVIQGKCPACGVQNESSRRFCRGCGESLEAPCLSCTKPMPMWEEICGECGGKQAPLVEERRLAMAARQAEAEGLLGDFVFDKAVQIATQLRDEAHPRLKHLSGWGAAFLEQIEKSRGERIREAVEAIAEAGKHVAEYDYLSAIFALETVPNSLRAGVLPGMRESAGTMLDRIKKTHDEARKLEARIKDKVAAKELADLLPDVEKLLKLRPDREDLQKIRVQLRDRQQKQAAARDKAIELAKVAIAAHDHEGAVAALSGVVPAMVTPEVAALRDEAEGLVRQLRSLAENIKQAIAAKQIDGLLGSVEEYLKLKPGDVEIGKLRQSLVEREEKYAAEIAARLKHAEELEKSCRFYEVRKLLVAISEPRRTKPVAACLARASRLGPLRKAAIEALSTAKSGGYAAAIESSRLYEAAIAETGIIDTEFTGLLEKIQTAYADEERVQRVLRRLRISVAAVAAVVMITAAGLWIRANMRAAALTIAIAQSRWDDALALAPDNVAALVGRARAKLQANPMDIDGAFADLDRAERGRAASLGANAARGDGHAMRALEQARADRLDAASQDLAVAKRLGAAAECVAAAQEALVAGWVVRAQAASDKGDVRQLQSDLGAALRAGAADDALAALKARALLLEAAAFVKTRDVSNATAKVIEATLVDMTGSLTALKLPANESLRSAVVAEYRSRFDEGLSRGDWDCVLRMAAAAGAMDDSAAGWVSDAIAKHPGGLSAVPPAMIAALPPLRNSIGMELKLIPAGKFMMGEAGGGSDEIPHEVILTKPYYIGVHEVTNAQWKRLMGSVPSEWKEADRPVEQVNWEDAVEFCEKLSAMPEERAAGRVYRLPTEAEWEYACRAGATTKYCFGDDESRLGEYGWFDKNSGRQTHPVGQKKANAWGLFDMHGNVWEWCSDWYAEYQKGVASDPQGPSGGSNRVFRGGGWLGTARHCRSANCDGHVPSLRISILGFRLALSPSGAQPVPPEAAIGK